MRLAWKSAKAEVLEVSGWERMQDGWGVIPTILSMLRFVMAYSLCWDGLGDRTTALIGWRHHSHCCVHNYLSCLDNYCQPMYHEIVMYTNKGRTTDEMLRPSAWLMKSASDTGHALATRAATDIGLDATTLDLLLRLRVAPEGSLRGVDLCEQLHKSPSHVSRVIDRSEAAGLVQRTSDPDDRRAHLITATAAGESVVDEYLPRLEIVLERVIFETLTAEEIETLIDLLRRISSAARSEIGATSPE